MEHLKKENLQQKLPPAPVATRWDTWFEMADYLHEYLNSFTSFVNTCVTTGKDKERNPAYINSLVTMTNDNFDELKHELGFVKDNCTRIVSLFKFFQSNTVNAASVYNILSDFQYTLDSNSRQLFTVIVISYGPFIKLFLYLRQYGL